MNHKSHHEDDRESPRFNITPIVMAANGSLSPLETGATQHYWTRLSRRIWLSRSVQLQVSSTLAEENKRHRPAALHLIYAAIDQDETE
jgi:hypothetical protein